MDEDPAKRVDETSLADGTRVLTLLRAHKANALDAATVDELSAWVLRSEEEDCRLLVIKADGKAFCGGFDFSGYEQATHGDLLLRFVRIGQLLESLRRASFASIALVQGAAMGAGADLAASCTFRIGARDCKFRFPGFRFGVALGTRHLAELIGMQKAREVLLNSATLGASEALESGLLTHLVDEETLQQKAEEIAAGICRFDRTAQRRIVALTSHNEGDSDLAELVRSVGAPGLHDRIARYRAVG